MKRAGASFAPAVTEPVARVAALESMLVEIDQQLRIALNDYGLPRPPADLHPADVIEKYLVRGFARKLSDLDWEARGDSA